MSPTLTVMEEEDSRTDVTEEFEDAPLFFASGIFPSEKSQSQDIIAKDNIPIKKPKSFLQSN